MFPSLKGDAHACLGLSSSFVLCFMMLIDLLLPSEMLSSVSLIAFLGCRNLFSLFNYHLPHLHNDVTMTHFIDLLRVFMRYTQMVCRAAWDRASMQQMLILCHFWITIVIIIVIIIISIFVASSKFITRRANPLIRKNSTNTPNT